MRGWRAVGTAVAAFGLLGAMAPSALAAGSAASREHDRIVAFWTGARVAKAVPRDFVRDPASGRMQPRAGKPGGGGSADVGGASWTKGGAVAKTTGKVLFAMGGSYWVCSASVVNDPGTSAGRAVVLTAGHCAYDETTGEAATNWMFIPDYDSAPAPLTTDGSFCAKTTYGCWTAQALVARREWTTAGGFTDAALPYDFAFAVVGPGGKNNTDLDATVGSQAIAFASIVGQRADAFGYPAEGKYHGSDLVYCEGTVGTDAQVANVTYRLGCDMSGGSSGGPWMSPFSATTGAGTLSSINSYGYGGTKAMFGPKFNANTQSLYSAAATATTNTIVG